MQQSSPPSLWRHRDFQLVWAGMALSSLGSAFSKIAYPLLVLETSQSILHMGLLTALRGLGALTLFFVGIVVDRADSRRLMIGTDVGQLAVYGLVPLWWWLLGPSLPLLYVCALASEVLFWVSMVAASSLLKGLVRREQLLEANSRLSATVAATFVIGPLLAGAFCAAFGTVQAVAVDALSFGVSAGLLCLVRWKPSAREAVADSPDTPTFTREEMATGFRFLRRNPFLLVTTLLTAGVGFVEAAIPQLLIFHLKETLSGSERAIGLVFAAVGLGGVLGSVLVSGWRRRWGSGPVFLATLALQGVALLAVWRLRSIAGVALLGALFTFGWFMRNSLWTAFRQELTPEPLLGRVTSASWTLTQVPTPLGAAAIALLAERGGSTNAFAWSAGFVLLLLGVGLFSPARARQPGTPAPSTQSPDCEPGAGA